MTLSIIVGFPPLLPKLYQNEKNRPKSTILTTKENFFNFIINLAQTFSELRGKISLNFKINEYVEGIKAPYKKLQGLVLK